MGDSRPFLLNQVSSAVDDNLIGLVFSHSHLKLLKDSKIVIRSDLNTVLGREICIVSGGGSGHEPSHAGFVGAGMLTASISGHIFASPSSDQIYRLIRYVNTRKTANTLGTLMIVPNYTGDRLHFGIVKERADSEGWPVEMLVFGDDCAFQNSLSSNKIGRRGLAGVFFMHKCAGALASRVNSLLELKNKLQDLASRIGSLSVSLTSCTIPGTGNSFKLPDGQMEIGLGIHGERGINRGPIRSAKEVVKLIIDLLFFQKSSLAQFVSENKSKSLNTRLAVLFNDNGGLTSMELNVIRKEALIQLNDLGFDVKMVFAGRFVTSLDMVGICISVMILDEDIENLLASSCETSIVSVNSSISLVPNHLDNIFMDDEVKKRHHFTADSVLSEKATIVRKALAKIRDCFQKNKQFLNNLDSELGDSDCGSTMVRMAGAIAESFPESEKPLSFEEMASHAELAGGTSGAIYGLLLRGAAKKCKEGLTESNIWRELLESGIANITKYSYTTAGDCSLVDPLQALVDFLKEEKDKKASSIFYQQIIETVKNCAEKTASMIPKVGRAAYSGKSIKLNQPDPGAYAVYLWVKEICDLLKEQK